MNKIPGILAVALAATLCFLQTGCTNQQTISDLLFTAGTAVASVAALEGNTSLATQLATDFQTASADVLAWKNCTTDQDVIEALNLVENDLSLIPVSAQDQALITLALGTVDGIISDIQTSAPAATANVAMVRHVQLAHPPKNSKDFTEQWNAVVRTDKSRVVQQLLMLK